MGDEIGVAVSMAQEKKEETLGEIHSGEFRVSTPVARIRLPDGGQKIVIDPNQAKNETRSNRNSNPKSKPSNTKAKGASKKNNNNSSCVQENKTNKSAKSCSKVSDGLNCGEAKDSITENLKEFSKRAQELKADISCALDRQAKIDFTSDRAPELSRLHESILELEPQSEDNKIGDTQQQQELDKLPEESKLDEEVLEKAVEQPIAKTEESAVLTNSKKINTSQDAFDPLIKSNLDPESKFVALSSSLQKQIASSGQSLSPETLEPLLRKLIQISETNRILAQENDRYRNENNKLILVKDKLQNLCRELQKSNNSIRIDSLSLIKQEQSKAKEQAAKIQSTLAGVMKLFDENQQRNLSLNKENLELQNKLRSLLEHCDNWEKSVDALLKQHDIENRLIKTELAKANLVENEEKERFLLEKKDLLKLIALMREQQQKIESQEARLRSDLSNYASKYDQCQTAISGGLSKFKLESKKMLKQLEKSRQDYVTLLRKYESSNKRIAQLLEERQSSELASKLAKKKIDTLEHLCRAIKSGVVCSCGSAKDQTICNNIKNNIGDQSNCSANEGQSRETPEAISTTKQAAVVDEIDGRIE